MPWNTPMSDEDPPLRLQLLRYIEKNPQAAETVAGVNGVWLKRPQDAAAVAEVESALEGLVLDGVLERNELPDGRMSYRRARGTE